MVKLGMFDDKFAKIFMYKKNWAKSGTFCIEDWLNKLSFCQNIDNFWLWMQNH